MRRRVKRALIVSFALVILAATLHVSLLDGVDGWLLAKLYDDDTQYAEGFSDARFRNVRVGNTEAEVIALLGPPLGESWRWEDAGREAVQVSFDRDGRAEYVVPSGLVRIGISSSEIQRLMGQAPDLKIFNYTRSLNDGSYRVRVIHFRQGLVTQKLHEYYMD
jgi:hypothetical protein